jgi:DNA-binding NtrC family response regulator
MSPSDPFSVLVVDDETIVRESLGGWFTEDGYRVVTAPSARDALKLAAEGRFHLALLDIKMPGMDGLELQARLAEVAPDLTIIVMTAYASVDTAVRALKQGAYDYIVKPFDPDELSMLVRRAKEHRSLVSENRKLKESLAAVAATSSIIGDSPAMRHVMELVASVAPTDATVLVQGRSGTGKELVAQALHASSPRRFNPLVAVHCGALAEGVIESELFGHEKGAFTGAAYDHKGKFEQADGGTIFLDEIGEVSPKVQVELLRVLEEKRVVRVGGRESVAVDFRVVAATNRDLEAMVREGRFREDLYWRLNVVAITIPPLTERREDVRTLAEHFLARFARQMNIKELRFSPEALDALDAHTWPGNVRELQNAIERAVVLGRPPVIGREDLPLRVAAADPARTSAVAASRTLADVERAHVETVLAASSWNITQAAAVLGVDRGTLYNKIQKYGLAKPAHAG